MDRLALHFYRLLMLLACVALLAAFGAVALGIAARLARWNLPGLDAYAGYAIAAALFLALPGTLVRGEHIRVTLVMERVPARLRAGLEWWGLLAALALAGYMAWFAARLAWFSWTTDDVSTGADATPLWIPQLAVVLGCAGFALALLHALVRRWRGGSLIDAGQAARTE
jgi:TRAP-type C4-dicarboxylate transport system permease small subunit